MGTFFIKSPCFKFWNRIYICSLKRHFRQLKQVTQIKNCRICLGCHPSPPFCWFKESCTQESAYLSNWFRVHIGEMFISMWYDLRKTAASERAFGTIRKIWANKREAAVYEFV